MTAGKKRKRINMSRRTKVLIVVGILGALILLITLLINRSGFYVEVKVLPEDSTVTLDGQPIEPGRIELSPGEHTFVASREFFGDATETVNTDNISSGHVIFLLPSPDTPEALQWLQQNPKVQLERENLGGQQFNQDAAHVAENYPYVEELPYRSLDFNVDYGFDENRVIKLIVTIFLPAAVPEGTPEYDQQFEQIKQNALDYLRSIEVDVDNTNIEFKADS
jgi:hypothetical protein